MSEENQPQENEKLAKKKSFTEEQELLNTLNQKGANSDDSSGAQIHKGIDTGDFRSENSAIESSTSVMAAESRDLDRELDLEEDTQSTTSQETEEVKSLEANKVVSETQTQVNIEQQTELEETELEAFERTQETIAAGSANFVPEFNPNQEPILEKESEEEIIESEEPIVRASRGFIPQDNGEAEALAKTLEEPDIPSVDEVTTEEKYINHDAEVSGPTSFLANEDTHLILTSEDLLKNSSDIDGDDLSIQNISVSNGEIIDNNDGTYTYIPNENFNGEVELFYDVTDGISSVPAKGTIQVNEVNDGPEFVSQSIESTEEGDGLLLGKVSVEDVDVGATASFAVLDGIDIPSGFTLYENGSYVFNPADSTYDHLGEGDSITLSVPIIATDNDGASDSTFIRIVVQGTNDAPVVESQVMSTVNEGDQVLEGSVSATDLDDNASLHFSITDGIEAPSGFVLNEDGSYTFDPANVSYDSLSVGDSFIVTVPVTVTDEHGATDTTQIQITVQGTNDVPLANMEIIANVGEGDFLMSGKLTSADMDGAGDVEFSISNGIDSPSGFTLYENGSYVFNPADDSYDHLNVGDSITLTVPVTVTDEHGATDITQIQITVHGTNDAPVASAAIDTNLEEGSSVINGQLTSTDLDDNATATFSVTDGVSLPSGFTLDDDGSYSFDPSDSSYDHLNVGDSITLTVPVTVTDDNGATDTTQVQITINGTNDAPIAGAEVSAILDENSVVLSGQLTSSDLDDNATATFSVTDGAILPSGFTLGDDGSYSFDPSDSSYDHLNVGDSVTLTIPVTVTDDNGATDTTQVQITINGTNDAPVAGAEVNSVLGEGSSVIDGQLTSSDLDDNATATFSVTDGAILPSGFTLDEDGSYSFDPSDSSYDHLNVGDSITLTVPVTVTDEHGATDITQVQITVNGTNDAPVAGAEVSATLDENSGVLAGQLTSSDLDDNATATFSVTDGVSLPSGFTLDEDGSYSFDPSDSSYDHLNIGDSITLTVPVTVTDEHGATDTTQVQITVNGTNDAPVAGAEVSATLDEGATSISGQLTSMDLDDNATATFSVTDGAILPSGFTLGDDGSYSFDPSDSSYDHLNVGDSITLTVPVTVTDDNSATDTTQVQITINGTNDAPVAGAEVSATLDENSGVLDGQLTSSDLDDNATATFSVTDGAILPSGFTLGDDGSYSFDPSDSSYDHLNVGDSITLTVPVTVTDDNSATDTTQVQITINGTNDAPVAGAEVNSVLGEGSSVIDGQLTSSDLDDNATAIFSVTDGVSLPSGFTLDEDGSYSFDPSDSSYDHLNVGDNITLTVPVTVTDEHGATDTTQVQIIVNGTNDAPVAGAEVSATLDEGATSISGQLTSMDLDDNSTATFGVTDGGAMPSGFTLDEDGSYSFDPSRGDYNHLNVGDSVTLTVPVTVTDEHGATDTTQVQITVNGTNDAPVAGAEVSATLDENSSVIDGQLTSTDVDDNSTATFSVSDGAILPSGFTLGDNGSYSFDPSDSSYDHLNVGDSITLTVPITVTDDNGATDTTQVQITVNGTNDAPVAGAEVSATLDENSGVLAGQLTSSDLDDNATATFSVTDGAILPSGFTLGDDGSYSFDPSDSSYDHLNVGDSVTLTIPVTVTDDNGATDTTQVQIIVNGTNDAPVAGAEVSATLDENSGVLDGQLTSTDLDDNTTATFSVSEGTSSPSGFTLNNDGSYSFDPSDSSYDHLNVGDSVTLTVPVTVTDEHGATDTTQVQIIVNGTNDAPVAGAEVSATLDEGSSVLDGQLTSTDLDDGSTATFSISDGADTPAGFVLNEDGSYSFDPSDSSYESLSVGDSQVLTIPVTVTDEHGATDTTQVQITVNGTNEAPVITSVDTTLVLEDSDGVPFDAVVADVDSMGLSDSFTISVDVNINDNPDVHTGNVYSTIIEKVGVDGHNDFAMSFNQGKLTIELNDDDRWEGGVDPQKFVIEDTEQYIGEEHNFTMSYDSADGGSISIYVDGNLIETIENVGDFNSADDGKLVVGGDIDYYPSVSSDPFDGTIDNVQIYDTSVTEEEAQSLADGEVLDSGLIVHYDFNGETPFDNLASDNYDGIVQGDAHVAVEVTEDTAQIIGNVSDVDGSIDSSNLSAEHGTVEIDLDGNILYTPDADYSGSDTVSISVTDNDGGTTSQDINVIVDGVNDSVEVSAPTEFNMNEDGTLTITSEELLSTSSDVDGDALSVSNVVANDGVLVDNGDGTYTFTPDENFNGNIDLSYDVSDGTATTHTTGSISVEAVNDAAEVSAPTEFNMNEDGTLTITSEELLSTSSDVDGDVLSISNVVANDGVLVDNGNGTYTFTPDENFNGNIDLSYDISDGTETTQATGSINVASVNDSVEISSTSEELITNGSFENTPNGPNAGTWNHVDSSNVDGWDSPDHIELWNDFITKATDGETLVELDYAGNHDSISQTIETVEGKPYQLSLDVNGRVEGTSDVEVYWGDELIATIEPTTGEWNTYTFELDGTGEDMVLEFREVEGQSNGLGALMDNISLVDTSPIFFNADEDSDITLTSEDLLATASDVDGDTLSVENLTATNGVITDNEDGTYTFSPNENFNGKVDLNYEVSDGTSSTPASGMIRVGAVNDAPVLEDVSETITEGAAVINGQLAATDIDDGSSLTYSISQIETNAVELNGEGQYVDLGDIEANSGFHNEEGEFEGLSYVGWVKADSMQHWGRLFDMSEGGHGNDNIVLANQGTSTNLVYEVWDGSDGTVSRDSDHRLTVDDFFEEGEWVHIAVTHESDGTVTVYKNGEVAAEGVIATPTNVDRIDNFLGKSNWSNDAEFDGSFDNVAVFSKGLSADEVQNAMDGDFDALDQDPSALFHYDFNGEEPFADMSQNGFDGTAVGNPEIVEADHEMGDGVPDGFVLNADGSYTFDSTHSSYDHLGEGESLVLTVPVTVTDEHGATEAAEITLTINGTNDAPVATSVTSFSVESNTGGGTEVGGNEIGPQNSWWTSNETIDGTDGNDTISVGQGDNKVINAGDGNDEIESPYVAGQNQGQGHEIDGGDGTDILIIDGPKDTGTERFNIVDNGDGTHTITHEGYNQWTSWSSGTYSVTVENVEQIQFSDGTYDIATGEFGNAPEDSGEVETLTITENDLLANINDAESDSLSIDNVGVSSGDLVDNGDGSYTYTPEEDFNGNVDLTYDVSDGVNTTSITGKIDVGDDGAPISEGGAPPPPQVEGGASVDPLADVDRDSFDVEDSAPEAPVVEGGAPAPSPETESIAEVSNENYTENDLLGEEMPAPAGGWTSGIDDEVTSLSPDEDWTSAMDSDNSDALSNEGESLENFGSHTDDGVNADLDDTSDLF